jgi:hypothetical protein
MFEFAFWPVPSAEKIELCKLYGPYLAICSYIPIILVIPNFVDGLLI